MRALRWKKPVVAVLVIALALAPIGCATPEGKRTAIGAGVGALLGAAAGALIDKDDPAKGALIGAAAGAAVGALVGYASSQFFVVDCVLPGQLRPIKTSAQDCKSKGGKPASGEGGDSLTPLQAWLPAANARDPEAQTNVGEIYEKGRSVERDYARAAEWYRKAADQGYARAQTNLGHLYERGLGVRKDPRMAAMWYERAAGGSGTVVLDSDTKGSSPTIEIVEPSLVVTRGAPAVPTRASSTREVVGWVTAPAGLANLTVNGRRAEPGKDGLFRSQVPVGRSRAPVKVIALDKQGRQTTVEFLLVPDDRPVSGTTPRPMPPVVEAGAHGEFGSYYALVVGNNDYTDKVGKLDTPVSDARAVADLLSKRYGFKTTLLLNASRNEILSNIDAMRKKLTQNDNLLIYFAGHGLMDTVNEKRGNWLPIDVADWDSRTNWIKTEDVTDILNAMPAKKVLVVADSCYSGSMTRSSLGRRVRGASGEKELDELKKMARTRSRTALTSGGETPVLDAGGGGHSVFANAFLDALAANGEVLEGQRLYTAVSARVTRAAQAFKVEQVPEYAPLAQAGHVSGDFFFVPRASSAALSGAAGAASGAGAPQKEPKKRPGGQRSQ